jgi:hypothetical protein
MCTYILEIVTMAGRKKLSNEKKRGCRIILRTRQDEYELLKNYAVKNNITVTDLLLDSAKSFIYVNS